MIRKLNSQNRPSYDRPNDDVTQVLVKSDDQGSSVYLQRSSLRFNRRKFTVAVTAFVLGGFLILMQSPIRNQVVSPGPLYSTHAQLIAADGGDQCAACHDAGNQDFGQWLSAMFRPGKKVQACQSQLCMKCHAATMNETLATKPHNVDPGKLKQLTEKHRQQFVSFKSGLQPPIDQAGNIECSACHREHHGQNDLKAMSDQQCQTCHASQIDSFETDHPEFTKWPQPRRQRIAFDHTTHHFKHFPSKGETFECSICHVDDRFKNVKLLASFEVTCAKCHQQDIEGRSEPGVQLIAMPMLDLDAIADEKLAVGKWPENATGDFDGRVPELMRLLLFKDPQARRVLEKRGSDFEFGDLDPDDSVDVFDAVQLAWSIKYLIYDLAAGGKPELRKRLEFAFQRSITEDELDVLTGGLNSSVFADTANRWLPGLAQEVPDHRARQINVPDVAAAIGSQQPLFYFRDDDPGLLIKNPLADLVGAKIEVANGGDFQTPNSVPSNDKPRSLGGETDSGDLPVTDPPGTASNPGNNWLTNEPEPTIASHNPNVVEDPLTAELNQVGSDPVFDMDDQSPANIPQSELLSSNPLTGNSRFRSGSARSRSRSQPQPLAGHQNSRPVVRTSETQQERRKSELTINPQTQTPADPQWLANNPLSIGGPGENVMAVNPERAGSQTPPKGPLPESQQKQITREFVEQIEKSQKTPNQTANNDALPKQDFQFDSGREKLVGSSGGTGWFRNDELYQITYRPAGHADRFLQTMMEVVSATARIESNPAALPYFQKMLSEASVGACNDCHTVDSVDPFAQVNWKAEYRDPLLRSFTRFSHGPHLTHFQSKDCVTCHALNQTLTNAHTFKTMDASVSISNFAPIKKSNCTSCHFEGSTNNSCTQCHNYHVGSRVSISLKK